MLYRHRSNNSRFYTEDEFNCRRAYRTFHPGSVLEKKIDRGARLIFLGLKFLIFLFFGVWKISLIFLGLNIFHLFLGGSNFDTIYFFGCPVRRIAQIAQRTYFFGFEIFMNLFFWV